jgi:hypothetical protein
MFAGIASAEADESVGAVVDGDVLAAAVDPAVETGAFVLVVPEFPHAPSASAATSRHSNAR